MRIRAVLFDFGGTLLDTATDDEAHRRAFAWFAETWGLPVDREALWRQHIEFMAPYWNGQPDAWRPLRDLTRQSFERLLRRYGREPTDEAWDRFWRRYLDAHTEVLRPYPDAAECLNRLAARGLHLGVLSDVDIDFMDFALGIIGFRSRFDSITTSEEVGVGKPNPKAFRLALQKAGCRPGEAVYVGDSPVRDVRGAKALGMRAIHLARTGEPAPEADRAVRSLREVAAIVEEWVR
ncbi:MAG: HAD-IA family hydrolase [Euryarchaeota archaeon]|nr:HAD-IA family hydrolase [Euryarchaeota archaeon]